MQANLEKALVVRVTGGEVWVVRTDGTVAACVLRGRHRIKERDFQVVAGDWVDVRPPRHPGDAWSIEEVRSRASRLSRHVARSGKERLIVANVERLYVVATLIDPPIFHDFVDRVLVSAEWGGVRASVVLNKTDLVEKEDADSFAELYRSCGYPVLLTNALTGDGVEGLSRELGDGVYAFVGASGVGKSSLLMSVDPGLDLKVREIGGKTGRGRHTTTFSQLYKFGRGYLADTPGIQTFGYPGGEANELAGCFPDFEAHAGGCRFHTCTHSHEPDCEVKRAVEEGAIAVTRHRSYMNILAEVEERNKRTGR